MYRLLPERITSNFLFPRNLKLFSYSTLKIQPPPLAGPHNLVQLASGRSLLTWFGKGILCFSPFRLLAGRTNHLCQMCTMKCEDTQVMPQQAQVSCISVQPCREALLGNWPWLANHACNTVPRRPVSFQSCMAQLCFGCLFRIHWCVTQTHLQCQGLK